MSDLAVLFLHLLTTIARLAGPGGARAVVAESVLVKHQLIILNRSRHRAPGIVKTLAVCSDVAMAQRSTRPHSTKAIASRRRSSVGACGSTTASV
jgi:hypothetical protein